MTAEFQQQLDETITAMSNQSPEFHKLLDYINATPELLSLLYDLDLMPEQVEVPSQDGNRMILIAAWHRVKFGEKKNVAEVTKA